MVAGIAIIITDNKIGLPQVYFSFGLFLYCLKLEEVFREITKRH